MKNTLLQRAGYSFALTAAFVSIGLFTVTGCTKDDTSSPSNNVTTMYDEVKLVADESSAGAAKTDPNLKNPWGIAIGSSGAFWLSVNGTGKSTVYDTLGASLLTAVTIPAVGAVTGSPTGVVFNNTTDFKITLTGETSKFIFATAQGTIAAWSSAGVAITVADRSLANASYTGLTIGTDSTGVNFIYAADFRNGRIDVYDKSFALVSDTTFADASIPAGYAPFNIKNIGGKLYVTYAKQNDAKTGSVTGAGNGYVNVFNGSGTLQGHFASQGRLNAPWGITTAPSGFGIADNTILVGNFGDGHINAFAQDGTSLGPIKDTANNALTIDGLWDITFPVNGQPAGDQNRLYFSAGTNAEQHGLFGYIKVHN